MKKIIALLLCLVLAAVSVAVFAEGESDKDYVIGKGKLIVGITDFEPMDFKDENGEWIGFDADLARAFAEYLGVEIEFQEIDWDNKVLELNGKSIDCVWNGMTLTDEVLAAMACSQPYNEQRAGGCPAHEPDSGIRHHRGPVQAGLRRGSRQRR